VTVVGGVDYNSNHIDVISRSALLTGRPPHARPVGYYYAVRCDLSVRGVRIPVNLVRCQTAVVYYLGY